MRLSPDLGETLCDDLIVREARLCALPHEREHGGGESCPERPGFERSNVGILEPGEGPGGQIVVAAYNIERTCSIHTAPDFRQVHSDP